MLNHDQFREQLMEEAGRHHAARLLGVHPSEIETSRFVPVPENFEGGGPRATHLGNYQYRKSGHEWNVSMALSPDEEASQHMATSFSSSDRRQTSAQVGERMMDHLYPQHAPHPGPRGWVPNPKDV